MVTLMQIWKQTTYRPVDCHEYLAKVQCAIAPLILCTMYSQHNIWKQTQVNIAPQVERKKLQ